MPSEASVTFQHVIKDAEDLVQHFDRLNSKPPPPENEVLKRATLIMAFAALETYFEDRLVEAVKAITSTDESRLSQFMCEGLANDLKVFHRRHLHFIRQLVLATDASLAS